MGVRRRLMWVGLRGGGVCCGGELALGKEEKSYIKNENESFTFIQEKY
jgi:hypothetical protein